MRRSFVPFRFVSFREQFAADGVFFVFAAVFGFSRLYVFPKYLISSVWYTKTLSDTQRLMFCFLLCTLLVLHIFWWVGTWTNQKSFGRGFQNKPSGIENPAITFIPGFISLFELRGLVVTAVFPAFSGFKTSLLT